MKKSDLYKIKRMFQYVKPCRKMYIIGIAFVTFSSFFSTVVLALITKEITRAIIERDINILERTIVMSVLFLVANTLISMISRYSSQLSTAYIIQNARNDAMEKIVYKKYEVFKNGCSGDILSRFNSDINQAIQVYTEVIPGIISPIIAGIGALCLVFINFWQMGIVVLISSIINYYLQKSYSIKFRNISNKIQKFISELTEKYVDLISGAMDIRIFNMQDTSEGIIETYCEQLRKEKMNRAKVSVSQNLAQYALGTMAIMGPRLLGLVLVSYGYMSIAVLIFVGQISGNIQWFFSSLGDNISKLQANLAGMDRFYELVDAKSEENMFNGDKLDNKSGYEIGFENLSIIYDNRNKVIDNLSFNFEENSAYTIVGTSGVGKSSLLKAILSFNDYSGNIKLGNKNIENYSLYSLRKSVSYVSQESLLFNGSIYDNIVFGKPDASESEVIMAAKKAFAHDFILKLPDGYNTKVGSNGSGISGGQRQRILLARAFLKDAPILLLDEVTSAVDVETEKNIYDSIKEMAKKHIVILISHRLLNITKFDTIIVIEDGKFVEVGSHEQLIKECGRYKKMFQMQSAVKKV